MKTLGLASIDKRTVAARALLGWQATLVHDLGGPTAVTAAQLALVELAVRTKLYVDHVDAFLLEQPSLILRRHRLKGRLLPLVLERQRLADGIVTKDEWVIEGISLAGGRKPLQLHTECFHLWELERHAFVAKTEPHIRAVHDGPNA